MISTKTKTAAAFKELLADTYTLYLKTQNYHWNVVGQQFISLHLLFEQQYEQLAEAVDETAERIRALGELAPASFEEFQTLKSMPEGKKGIDAQAMIADLQKSYEVLCGIINKVMEVAKSENDEASLNFLADQLEKHEKTIWMLNAHLI